MDVDLEAAKYAPKRKNDNDYDVIDNMIFKCGKVFLVCLFFVFCFCILVSLTVSVMFLIFMFCYLLFILVYAMMRHECRQIVVPVSFSDEII